MASVCAPRQCILPGARPSPAALWARQAADGMPPLLGIVGGRWGHHGCDRGAVLATTTSAAPARNSGPPLTQRRHSLGGVASNGARHPSKNARPSRARRGAGWEQRRSARVGPSAPTSSARPRHSPTARPYTPARHSRVGTHARTPCGGQRAGGRACGAGPPPATRDHGRSEIPDAPGSHPVGVVPLHAPHGRPPNRIVGDAP